MFVCSASSSSYYYKSNPQLIVQHWRDNPIEYDDRAGAHLADGLCGLLWALRSDLDLFAKE